MSLNKFTDISVKKQWMDINCNELVATSFSVDTLDAKQLVITQDAVGATVYIRMINEQLPADSKDYGFYSSTVSNAFWLAKFSDLGGANVNYLCFEAAGGITIPTATLRINSGGLNLNSAGALLNVPSSSTNGSFYETFTSVGNTFIGAFAVPIASEYTLTRIGNVVHMNIGTVSGPGANATILYISQTLPVQFRPSFATSIPIRVESNSVNQLGLAMVDNLIGGMTFQVGMATGGNFSTTGTCGLVGVSISWKI